MCLTVWTRSPAVILSLAWGFQALAFICGIATPSIEDYVFWQFLTSLMGVLLGVLFLAVTKAPQMLRARASHAPVWIVFMAWLVLFLGSQLFYAFFPPPGQPWGLLATLGCHACLFIGLWISLSSQAQSSSSPVFRDYLWTRFMFSAWICTVVAVEAMFFLLYAMASDKWVAYIACGAGALVLVLARLSFWSFSDGAYKRAAVPLLVVEEQQQQQQQQQQDEDDMTRN